MATTNAHPKTVSNDKQAAVRDERIILGTDARGVSHLYHTPTESVFQIAPDGSRPARKALGSKDVGTYVDAVEEQIGWSVCRYGFGRLLESFATAYEEAKAAQESDDDVDEEYERLVIRSLFILRVMEQTVERGGLGAWAVADCTQSTLEAVVPVWEPDE